MSNEMAGVTPEQVERIAAIVAREVVGKFLLSFKFGDGNMFAGQQVVLGIVLFEGKRVLIKEGFV